jgi:hypothetical protein
MTTLIRVAAMLAALTAFAPPALAQAEDTLELAGRLFERAGLGVQLQSLPEQFAEGVAQNRGELPDELIAALAEAGKKSYAPAALRAEIVPALAKKMPAGDLKQVIAWLEGPLGRRVTLVEESSSSQMTPEAMQEYFEREKENPASAKRAKLIADLGTATNAAEIGASLIEAMSLGIAVGMDAAQPAEKRIGIATLRERLRAVMPPDKVRANMAASLPGMYGFIYRDISDADLDAYLKFNTSPLGKRYNDAVTEALAEALTHASVRVGELVQAGPKKKQI